MDALKQFLQGKGIDFESNVDLRKKTWIHRGGNALFFISPKDTFELEELISFLYQHDIQHLIVGGTSNLYIQNSVNIPVVVSTLKCNSYILKEGSIVCDCGVLVSKLAKQMIDLGIKGFEFLTQLPGTIGGAICNNSSVQNENNSITQLLIDFDIVTRDGLKTMSPEDLHLSFRSSDIKKHLLQGVILKARLVAEMGDPVKLHRIATINEEHRKRILDEPSHNLGCTVHKMFSSGPMPRRYAIPYKFFTWVTNRFIRKEDKRKRFNKAFLLFISGHRRLIPYISDKQLITFIWKDDNADALFDEYLEFMRIVCKTSLVEIEVIK